jgi:ubiquinone biosynthesis protein UbiJ
MAAMNPADPFQFLSDLWGAAGDKFGSPRLPHWLDHELRNRLLLAINHVLQQHPHAQQRLLQQKDKIVHAQWRSLAVRLKVTPAGLFALADEAQRENLSLHIEADNPLQLARQAISGQHPQVHVSGDAAFADTMNWLLEHVHWNGEADLARLIGADAARQVADITRLVRTALQRFVSAFAPASAPHDMPMDTPTDVTTDAPAAGQHPE